MIYYDLHVRSEDIAETVKITKLLGWSGLGLVTPWTNLAELKKFKESIKPFQKKLDIAVGVLIETESTDLIKKVARKVRKDVEMIFVSGGDLNINRTALSTPEVDVLTHPWLDRTDPGFDYVMAKLAAKNNIAIQFSFGELLHTSKRTRTQLLANFLKAAKLINKYKVPFIITSGAMTPFCLRGPGELSAFGQLLNLREPKIKQAMSDQIIVENRKRLGKKWVMPGVEIE